MTKSFSSSEEQAAQIEALTREVHDLQQALAAEQQARRQMTAQAMMYDALMEAAADAVAVVGSDGVLRRVNDRLLKLFGYTQAELLGQPVERLLPDRYQEGHVHYRQGYIEQPHLRPMGIGMDLLARRADGTEFPVEISLSYIQHEGETLVMAFITDITERKAAAEALHHYAAELEARNAELDAFSHTIAHDLKAPLNLVSGYAVLLLEEFRADLPEDALLYISEIEDAGMRMARMIDQLLTLAVLRGSDYEVAPVDMEAAAAAAITRFRMDIEDRNVSIELARPLPPVMGQPVWVEEVLANLIGNAIKYSGEDNPAPRLVIAGEVNGDCVRYTVTDNGVGIAPGAQDTIFEMFARAHDGYVPGLGLGLSIVQRIVTKLGGDVGVESTPGQGSTFWFTLPAA